MDAIDVGVGNEAVPTPRKLGLIIMGRNPMAVDLVGARLLGYNLDDVPYLKRAAERGYRPSSIEEIDILGDMNSTADLDKAAESIQPYDEEYHRWQDIAKELERLGSPIRYYWGYSRKDNKGRCETGCVMGAKMFFGFLERYAGEAAFKKGKPAVMVIGKVDQRIDAGGHDVFLVGSCADADIVNAKKVVKIDNCFTTAVDMAQVIRGRLGLPTPILDPAEVGPLIYNMLIASAVKVFNLRYAQDIWHFLTKSLQKRL
jgi:hypothetical protein